MAQERQQTFSLEQVALAPPVAERASAFRHRNVLRAFTQGVADVLSASLPPKEQARRLFGGELLRGRPHPRAVQQYREQARATTVIVPVLRFLPHDQVDAELWAYSEQLPQGVRIAHTPLHYREALNNQWQASAFGDVLCPHSCCSEFRAPATQARNLIHPNLQAGGTASGLPRAKAEAGFYRMGDLLAHTVQKSERRAVSVRINLPSPPPTRERFFQAKDPLGRRPSDTPSWFRLPTPPAPSPGSR